MGKDKGGKGGVVVNIASIVGLEPMAGCPVYVGTKHAVVGITRSFGVSVPKNNGHFTPELLTTFGTSLLRRTDIQPQLQVLRTTDFAKYAYFYRIQINCIIHLYFI
jgi:short-subunit dehydrogenase